MELEGWKLLLLVRLSPLVPYNLLNIAMAATKIHFWAFAVVSFFGARRARDCRLMIEDLSLKSKVTPLLSSRLAPCQHACTGRAHLYRAPSACRNCTSSGLQFFHRHSPSSITRSVT